MFSADQLPLLSVCPRRHDLDFGHLEATDIAEKKRPKPAVQRWFRASRSRVLACLLWRKPKTIAPSSSQAKIRASDSGHGLLFRRVRGTNFSPSLACASTLGVVAVGLNLDAATFFDRQCKALEYEGCVRQDVSHRSVTGPTYEPLCTPLRETQRVAWWRSSNPLQKWNPEHCAPREDHQGGAYRSHLLLLSDSCIRRACAKCEPTNR